MMDLEYSFGPDPVEALTRSKQPGDSVSAAQLLTLLESENQETVEDALLELETMGLVLDIGDLPRTMGAGETAVRLRREAELAKGGLRPDALEETDPLRIYLEEVAGTPAQGDEQLLAQRCAEGSANAADRLTELGLSRVIAIALEHTGFGVLLMDLIQEGSLGLWQAIQNYREGDYAAFRDSHIRFQMAKAITLQARDRGVGQKLRTAMEDYRAVDERLLSDLGRNPTVEEIAEELHLTLEETQMVRRTMDNARLMQKARQEQEEPEQTEEDEQAVENTALFQMRQRIAELLSDLSEADQKLLTLRFGLEGGLPMSTEDTGKRLGLTPEEVVAREAAALAKLRSKG